MEKRLLLKIQELIKMLLKDKSISAEVKTKILERRRTL